MAGRLDFAGACGLGQGHHELSGAIEVFSEDCHIPGSQREGDVLGGHHGVDDCRPFFRSTHGRLHGHELEGPVALGRQIEDLLHSGLHALQVSLDRIDADHVP